MRYPRRTALPKVFEFLARYQRLADCCALAVGSRLLDDQMAAVLLPTCIDGEVVLVPSPDIWRKKLKPGFSQSHLRDNQESEQVADVEIADGYGRLDGLVLGLRVFILEFFGG